MFLLHCDICGDVVSTYRDSKGEIWEDFTIRERRRRKPKIGVASFHEYFWNELHVCGKCRKAIAEYSRGKYECAEKE